MKNRIPTIAVGATLLALVSACGGGGAAAPATAGAEAEPPSGAANGEEGEAPDAGAVVEEEVLAGVFVDGPVANLAWRTETRSGVTGLDGGFEYLAGETITFSLGGLTLPPAEAAARLTPLDLARDADDAERFAVNLARLLQTLDADGLLDNGLQLSDDAVAAAAGAAIDFDVDVETFASDAGVAELLSRAGGIRTELVSEKRAREHFGRTLAARGEPGSTAGLEGFWELDQAQPDYQPYENRSPVDADFQRYRSVYYALSGDGELTVLTETAFDSSCYNVDHRVLTPLADDVYLVSSTAHGGMERLRFSVREDRLVVPSDAAEVGERTAGAASESVRASLELCPGQSMQRPPAADGPNAAIAGLWQGGDDAGSEYYLVSAHGSAEHLVRRDLFGPAPDYAPSSCYEAVDIRVGLDEDVFRAFSDDPWDYSWGYRTFRPDGDVLAVGGRDGLDESVADTLSRSGIDATSLPRCHSEADDHPLDDVAGLWRNEDETLFGHYVGIDREAGTLTTYEPGLGGIDCFVETSSTLVATGGYDFVRQLADGTERSVRMAPGDERLVISDLDAEGRATPVRWLQSVVGLEPDLFAMCRVTITAADLEAIAPLTGVWSRTTGEWSGAYGPEGAEVLLEANQEFWTIDADGMLRIVPVTTELVDFRDYAAGYRTCRGHSSGSEQMDPVSGDVFRFGYDAWTLRREGDSLNAATSYEELALERSDVDVDALEHCNARSSDPEEGLWGVWELDPFEPGTAGRLLVLQEYDSEHQVVDFDPSAECRSSPFRSEALANGRRLLSGVDADRNAFEAIARLTTVDGRLDVAFDSVDERFPFAAGRYRRVSGFDADRLGYRDACFYY